MTDGDRAIRALIEAGMAASKAGDTAKVLCLMIDGCPLLARDANLLAMRPD